MQDGNGWRFGDVTTAWPLFQRRRVRTIEHMTASNLSVNLTHHFLIAMPTLVDPNFGGTVVYLAEHNEKGALGLVINRTMELNMRSLFERIELKLADPEVGAAPVHYGGPVQPDRGFVLHAPIGSWGHTINVQDEVGLTSSKDVLEAVARGEGPEKLMVALGYSSWGPGQLETELSRNSWLTVPADSAVIFETPVEQRSMRAFGILGINPAFLVAAGRA